MKRKTRILNIFREIFRVPFLENRLRNISMGRSTSSLPARLVPNNYQYPVGSFRSFDYKGINLKLDIHDYVSHYLYFGFKDSAHEKLMSLVKEGDVLLDIGTNYGTTILQFARIIGDKGKAYGFEPDPVNFEICQDNLVLNRFSNISVENIGLGRQTGEAILVIDTESNRGGNRIGNPSATQEWHKVQIRTLDDWIRYNDIHKIDLIKIDVEGFEMEVLSGAVDILSKLSPPLFVELDNNNLSQQKSSAKELVTFLEGYDYRITHAESGETVSSNKDLSNCHFDIVCIRDKS